MYILKSTSLDATVYDVTTQGTNVSAGTTVVMQTLTKV